ncbi:MAG: hypothetical protein C0609_04490 [Deltaproteobacteria bacterium]|nr:MAG: hypothetical protein C0609_04490 [Deltaproteobacteria bacterium]
MRHLDEIIERIEKKLKGGRYLLNISLEDSTAVEAKGGKACEVEQLAEGGLGLCVELSGGRLGFTSTTFGDEAPDVELICERALASAAVATIEHRYSLPEALDYPPKKELKILDPESLTFTPALALSLAAAAERAAYGVDRRVASVRRARCEGGVSHNVVAVNGSHFSWMESSYSVSLETGARDGEEGESGWAESSTRLFASLDPESIGREAGERAVGLLGGGLPKSGRYDVVLDSRVALDMLDVIGFSLIGENVSRGKSLLAEMVGKRIFSDKLNIIDDGLLTTGIETAPLDGEGSARRLTRCVESGVLTSYLYDRRSAAEAGVGTTGNGTGGVSSRVEPSCTNLFIAGGKGHSQRDLIGSLANGVLVSEVMGIHTIDPISGEFSLGFSGQLITGGEITAPLTGGTISGNILDLFSNVEVVGEDMRFQGGLGAPSLLLSGVEIAGQ